MKPFLKNMATKKKHSKLLRCMAPQKRKGIGVRRWQYTTWEKIEPSRINAQTVITSGQELKTTLKAARMQCVVRARQKGKAMADILDLVGRLDIGTRIRFNRTLTERANGDHPALLYAHEGEKGTIVGYGASEGYWVKTENCSAKFGAAPDEFDVEVPNS